MLKRYTLLHEDGEIQTLPQWRIKITNNAGRPWAIIAGEKYHIAGRWHHFYYRTLSSLWIRKAMGLQKIWVKGNPSPIFLGGDIKPEALRALNDTARRMYKATEEQPIDTLMRRRRVDWMMIILVGIAALGIGVAIGGRT